MLIEKIERFEEVLMAAQKRKERRERKNAQRKLQNRVILTKEQ